MTTEPKSTKIEMRTSDAIYHPTLWRTCRVLANVKRLACLRSVLTAPDSPVGEIARATRLSLSHASLHLRAIQARGLIRARRESRWVRYVPLPDPLVKGSEPILDALRPALLSRRQADLSLVNTLTGFTHPRRLVVLRLLRDRGPLYTEDLRALAKISQPALWRHMRKLRQRALVTYHDDKWFLAKTRSTLAQALLKLL